MKNRNPDFDTLIRYAGRKLTQEILAVLEREIETHFLKEKSELRDIKSMVGTCKAWLDESNIPTV